MAGLSVAGVSLLLLGAFAVSVTAKCRVTSAWETKDHLIQFHVRRAPDGQFMGTFTEKANGKTYNITGFQEDENSNVAFIMTSASSGTAISYLGQCFTPPDGEDLLKLVKLELDPVGSHTDDLKPKQSNLVFKRIYMV